MSSALSILNSGNVHIREQAKIDAARIAQKGRNELKAAQAGANQRLQAFVNQQRVTAAGEQRADILSNMARNLDAATSGRLLDRLAASEAIGANIAAASAAGVGGTTVDMVNSTLRVNESFSEERQDRAIAADMYAMGKQAGNVMDDAYSGQDMQTFQAGLDYSQYVDHVKMSGLQKVVAFAGAATATYFGGPQAGDAVLGLFDAQNRAANGDFDGAASRYATSFTQGVNALSAYTKRGNEAWGSPLLASVRRRWGNAGPQIQ